MKKTVVSIVFFLSIVSIVAGFFIGCTTAEPAMKASAQPEPVPEEKPAVAAVEPAPAPQLPESQEFSMSEEQMKNYLMGIWYAGKAPAENYQLVITKDDAYSIRGRNPEGISFDDKGTWSITNYVFVATSSMGIEDRIWTIEYMEDDKLILKNVRTREGREGDLI